MVLLVPAVILLASVTMSMRRENAIRAGNISEQAEIVEVGVLLKNGTSPATSEEKRQWLLSVAGIEDNLGYGRRSAELLIRLAVASSDTGVVIMVEEEVEGTEKLTSSPEGGVGPLPLIPPGGGSGGAAGTLDSKPDSLESRHFSVRVSVNGNYEDAAAFLDQAMSIARWVELDYLKFNKPQNPKGIPVECHLILKAYYLEEGSASGLKTAI